jgi:hypothetical protein
MELCPAFAYDAYITFSSRGSVFAIRSLSMRRSLRIVFFGERGLKLLFKVGTLKEYLLFER